MHRRVVLIQRTELALGALSAVLAALAGAYALESAAAWVAVAASVSASVVAFATGQRFAYQQLEFSRTADELERLLRRWRTAQDRSADFSDAFVADCESAISIQNESWMVRWTIG